MDEQASRALKRQMDRRRGAAIIDGNLDSFRADGYTNLLTKYGTSQDSSNYWNYERENYEDDLHLLSLYEGNGLFAKIIDIPSEEAVKHGLDIDWKDDNISEYIEKRLDELDFEDKFSTAEKWARLYGGAIGVLITNDGKGLEEPLDMNGFRSIEEIRVFERAIVQPDYSRLGIFQFEDSLRNNMPYNEPEFYTVSSIYGYFTVHRSRCLIFRNGRLPEQTTSENYRYWGMPEYVRIKRALRECQTSHGLGVRLLERCSQAIYKMKNLANLLSTDQGEEQVLRRLQVIDMARGILNSISIDSDGEDYDFKSNSMAGVKDIIDSTCNMLSAVTNIPQTRLFGRSPAGENATGKSDQENYYSMVENIQKQNMKKNVRKLLDLVLRQGVIEGKLDSMPDYKVKFAALWSLDDQEQAQLDQTKAATEKTKADTLNVYMQAQVIDPSEVRAGLASKDALDIETLVDDTEPVDAGETTEGMDPAMQAGMEDAAAQMANAALQQVRANPDEPSMGESATDPATDEKATELATAALTAIKGGLDQQADDVTIKPKQAENGPIPGASQADPDGRATAFAEAALAAVKKNESNTDGDDTKCGVGVIIMNGDRVLCGVRSDNGQICGPGGHIQDDETPEQAAVRETQEEFGVTPTGLTVIGHTTPAPGSTDCPSTIYLATGFTGTIHTDHEEMNGAIWATPGELSKAVLFGPFKESLKLLDFPADKREDGAPFGNTNAEGPHKGYINKHARESAKKVIGTKTGDGVEIKQFSTHAMQRMSERNMYDKAVLNALKDPNPEKDTKHGSDSAYIYEYPRKNGMFYTVIVDHSNGTVITTINPKKSKKGKGNGEKDTSGSEKP